MQLDSEALLSRSHALVLVLAKVAISALVLATGFRALSDDDYARVVIAQRFAEMPSVDPSGTSWLPFPFWIYGSAFRLFGPSLDVARGVALGLGVLTTLAVYVAARWLGLTRNLALAGTLLSNTIAYAAWFGVATVPDGPTAALILLGVASLNCGIRERWFGACALGAACLSRYEAWPVTLAFGALTLWDARRERSLQFTSIAIASALPAALWMLNGKISHDDIFFFIKRVSDYKRALGAESTPLFSRIVAVPWRLVRFEPALFVLCGYAIWFSLRHSARHALSRYLRSAIALSALLLFLVAGELSDGVPTHHSERTLLPIWFVMAIVGADSLARASQKLAPEQRKRTAFGLIATICAALVMRPYIAHYGSFAERSAEVAIGERARALEVPKLAISTEDYGYFAVIAAFGAPARTVTLRDHDPRKKALLKAATTSPTTLLKSLRASSTRFLVTTRDTALLAALPLVVRGSNGKFVLLELTN